MNDRHNDQSCERHIPDEALAHISADDIHLLRDHLQAVGELAARFAADFDSEAWGKLAGLWHDGGKFAKDFQRMIRQANGIEAHVELGDDKPTSGRVDHSSAGAVLASKTFGNSGLPLSFVIAGHHAGLADFEDSKLGRPLKERLRETESRLDAARAGGWDVLPSKSDCPTPPRLLTSIRDPDERNRRTELWIRLLFSALVDADFLDTERFFNTKRAAQRSSAHTLAELSDKLDAHIDQLASLAAPTPVNQVRAEILSAARAAAELAPGLFSLTVPTGGGKTLASLSFALRHARAHGKHRVIVAIPFTSIIEQTAAVYRKALGDEAVIEHHTNLDPSHETAKNRLASENWDAPIVVTTNVQLFESLLANRPSRCRKLHNLVGSVIILDEAQTIPPAYLSSTLDLLTCLTRDYGASIVLCTATQPALNRRPALPEGLSDVREIIPDPQGLSLTLRRVRMHFPRDASTPITWPALAERVAAHPRALAIVHRRDDARDLLREVDRIRGDEAAIHLSALMCAAHRADALRRARARLDANEPITLVTTQLVEAGVDIDFPVVYRALGGLDALAQAAGRCNREGKLPGLGDVYVFVAPTAPPPGILQQGLEAARAMLAGQSDLDPFAPATIEAYFRRVYFTAKRDEKGIQTLRRDLKFRQVAAAFKLIDEDTLPVAVPYGDGEALAALRQEGPSRAALRRLQRFVVAIPRWRADRLQKSGVLESVHDTVLALRPEYAHLYDVRLGLLVGDDAMPDPTSLIV